MQDMYMWIIRFDFVGDIMLSLTFIVFLYFIIKAFVEFLVSKLMSVERNCFLSQCDDKVEKIIIKTEKMLIENLGNQVKKSKIIEELYRNKILEENRLSSSSNQEQVKELSPIEQKIQARANALTLENEVI